MGGKLALILMAAGAGRRFNGDKLPLWQQALETARLAAEGKNALLIPVTRIPGLFNSPGVIPVENFSPALGVSHTVRLGVKKAAELGAEGAVFLVCDQPLLRPATLARLMLRPLRRRPRQPGPLRPRLFPGTAGSLGRPGRQGGHGAPPGPGPVG